MARRFQLKFTPQQAHDEEVVKMLFLKEAAVYDGRATVVIRKKSLDARSRQPYFLITADVYLGDEPIETMEGFKLQNVSQSPEIHIIGAGPAGMFAALELIELGFKPVVIERGKAVRERRRDLARMNKELLVNPESNYCFGEGGAGTYSDGKLYTRSSKRGPVDKVLQCLIEHGATEKIAIDAHPHIGTNKLPQLVENMRNSIVECGGEVRFEQKLVGLNFEDGKTKLKSIVLQQVREDGSLGDVITENVKAVILATGHSARDIFELLNKEGVAIEAKPFALGVRVEHPQSIVDQIQYKCGLQGRGDYLPPSSYSLVEQVQGRGVFSFCMCPGGIIAPAATSPGEVVVNGWSPSKRNGEFANSGYVVSVDDADFKPFQKHGELRAMFYQAAVEQRAFDFTGSLVAPAQRMEDFILGNLSSSLPANSYIPGTQSADLRSILPEAVHTRIRESLVILGKKMPAFRTNEAILVGVESRTSSPVRIPRDKETLQHNGVLNLYPCGEGAGYAGGIMSAALDGMRVAAAVVDYENG